MVQVSSDLNAYPVQARRSTVAHGRIGRPSVPRYRDPESTLAKLVTAAGPRSAQRITWRPGSRRRGGRPLMMSSRFVFLRVRPAGRTLHRAHRGHDLPEAWLIAEWPPNAAEPVKYWLSNLPEHTPKHTLVRWAKLRWRIEHDYREVKTGLGLHHYEGRTWTGWHHHVTLISAAHAFLTLQRLDPKTHAPE